MLRSDYAAENCSIARTLEVIGERWTMLLLREAFLGTRRFDDFQRTLGVARNVLQSRLERLVEAGVFERRRYQDRPERYEYVLTSKGADLWPVLVSLLQWGDRHAAPDGPPVVLQHNGCGGEVDDRRRCSRCGQDLDVRHVTARRGPGASQRQQRLPAPAPTS
jgi:DNA-binding HxlR family transcriptional regulator